MRRAWGGAVLALVLVLAACAGLPTSGQVNPGLSPVDAGSDPEIRFVPNGPQQGASPEDIVNGFIRAGSGPQGEWAIARQFLAPDFAAQWNPRASVIIDRLAHRTPPTEPVDGVSTMQVVPTGLVDASGAYSPQDEGSVTLSFTLEQVDGEWRISDAPDGVVLFEEEFRSVYDSVSLFYFDRDYSFLVPDERWFPSANIATAVATALVDGQPSAWLAGAVVSAFPEDVTVSGAVPSVDDSAQVELSDAALSLGQTALGRMQAQLEASLRTADVAAVQMTVNGTPLQASAATVRGTLVYSQSLVKRADGSFGFADGDGVEDVPVSEALASVAVDAVEVAPDLTTAAARTTAGVVLRAGVDGELATLDERPGLVPPTIDPSGTILTVPAASPPVVLAHPVDGPAVAVADAWAGAASISAMRVSRDGTRMAATVVNRGRTELWVAGIRRSAEGTDISLGDVRVLASLDGDAMGLAWLDDTTLGVLVTAGGEMVLREQPVGGPGSDLTVPDGAVAIAGGNSRARLRSGDGVVYVRQGPNWAQTVTGVAVLAGQQGMP